MALYSVNPLSTNAWKNLQEHFETIKDLDVRNLFKIDTDRFSKFSIQDQELLLDFSKNKITDKTFSLLLELAHEVKLQESIDKYFTGDIINVTENRAVLHTALRCPKGQVLKLGNKNIITDVQAVKLKIKKFVKEITSGARRGFSNKQITDVVNIGIGGSDLGPRFVTEALSFYKNNLNTHFVSNIDGDYIHDLLKTLNPETTLFIVVSKTFTTDETLTNATTIKDWFLKKGCILDIERHFVAVTSNVKLAESFGIASDNIFPMWDWVGGRYSLWSAVGLSIALSIGYKNFELLLEGGHQMDQHFREAPFKSNIPVVLALLSIWYANFHKAETEAIIGYSQYLERLPNFLQQLVMESNGKFIDRNGKEVNYQTGTVIWGDCGTNAQHAFFQHIHQGTKLIPVDFIGFVNSLHQDKLHHNKLMANLFAQTDALLSGRNREEVDFTEQDDKLKPYKYFKGNKPSNTLLFDKLTPQNLGKLIAMYEHKTFVQGVIWNIYSYDQFGVELGKNIFAKIFEDNSKNILENELFFTNQILKYYNQKSE